MDNILASFPYQSDTKGQLFPVISLRFHFGEKFVDTAALVDSGATISIFRADVVQDSDLVIENGKEIYLGGIAERVKGYLHNIQVEISEKQFLLPVVFSYEYRVSFNLLGRKGFFEKFDVLFEERKGRVQLV
ncbi:MAG: hypothetical protein G01um101416_833 [Microgenomates group bacterium Gr01-1014_16]|nr:MAG: hypothetical protein G01um101416_833 [Microgenomates group bacterium Gr01-1014_16]